MDGYGAPAFAEAAPRRQVGDRKALAFAKRFGEARSEDGRSPQ
jgi:hypothetical protein